jgi:hypothetical protein
LNKVATACADGTLAVAVVPVAGDLDVKALARARRQASGDG